MKDAAYTQARCPAEDGVTLAYRDYENSNSSAVPILCLHGLTRTCRDFEGLAPVLSRRARVLALDFRGRGKSGRDPDFRNYHPVRYAQDTLSIMDDAGISRACFVGTSLGGLVSMALAQRCPDRVAAVVLNDVGTRLSPEGIERISQYVGKLPPVSNWEEAAAQQKMAYGQALPDYSDEQWLAHARRCFYENESGVPVADCDPNIARAIEVGTMPSFDPVAAFQSLGAIPTLLVRGAHSDILSRETVEDMVRTKPDLEYAEVPNRGHAPMLNEPAALTVLEQFFTSVNGGP